MENLNKLIRSEYADYLRERLIIRTPKQRELDVFKNLSKSYEVVELIGANMYRVKSKSTDEFWGLVSNTGEIILPQEYIYIDQFENEHVIVYKDEQLVNAIDKNGKLVFSKPLKINVSKDSIYYQYNQLKFYGQYYSINGKLYDVTGRNLQCDELFKYTTMCYTGEDTIWLYKQNENISVITGKTTMITPGSISEISMVFPNEYNSKTVSGITTISHGANEKTIYAYARNGKKISNWHDGKFLRYTKSLVGYKYYSSVDSKEYNLKHQPIAEIGDYILCSSKKYSFLYNKKLNMYEMFYNISLKDEDITLDNNVLAAPKYSIKYYIDGSEMIDISFLEEDEVVERKNFDGTILSFHDYEEQIKNDSSIMAMIEQKAVNNKAAIEQANASILQLETDERRQKIIHSMELLQQELLSLENFTAVQKRSNITSDLLFIKKDEHFEIREAFKNILAYFDLSQINFTNVNVSSLDFSYTNAMINPQSIYNKDMSNGVYKNISFLPKDFSGVNLCGADLSECNLDFAILDGAITDDKTVLPHTNVLKK